MARYKTSKRRAYAIVCNNQSAVKLDDQTPDFVFLDGKISEPDLSSYKDTVVEQEPDNAVEKSVRYIATIQTICTDEATAKYACLNLMIKHQGTGAVFHVEEVTLDNTSRLYSMCESLKNLLAKVEVKKLIELDDESVTPTDEDIFGDDGQD